MKNILLLSFSFIALLSPGQSVLYSQDFANGTTGVNIIDSTGSSYVWTYSHIPFSSLDYGDVNFASPTAANGFAVIVSDGSSGDVGTDLYLPAINCTGQAYVGLQFSQWYTTTGMSSGSVWVSTDSINWTEVYDAGSSSQMNAEAVRVDISALAANQPKVYLMFDYVAGYDLWWAIDDIYVTSKPASDVIMDLTAVPDFAPANSNLTVRVVIDDPDTVPITSLVLSYTFDNQPPVNQTFSGLYVYPYPYYFLDTLDFTVPVSLPGVGAYPLRVSLSQVNGVNIPLESGDTISKSIIALSHIPNRNVLLEEYTGALCGYCPMGSSTIESIMQSPDSSFIIPVSLHAFQLDAMTTPEATTLGDDFAAGFPMASVDRMLYPFNADFITLGNYDIWQPYSEIEHKAISPASLSASNTYDSGTGLLTVTVSATFYGPVTADLRMNCYVTEDSVVGQPGTGYDQTSYYYASPTTGNPWLYVGDFQGDSNDVEIPGFVHHNVERLIMNGIWGDSCTTGNIPPTTADGATYTQTYTATLSPDWRANFIKVDAFLCEYNNPIPPVGLNLGQGYYNGPNIVLNAVRMDLNSSSSSGLTTALTDVAPNDPFKVKLYPNPAKDLITLNFSLDDNASLDINISNAVGQSLTQQEGVGFAKGNYSYGINTSGFDDGFYFLTLKDQGNKQQTLRFVIAR